ncbi:RING-H2 finger protein ATL16-like [Impatiens glandulifera]|uniref:RING-H2 finger protein ATL16-like n=1 Tax=Impatiens glandulifera TaxID=253017 RepID=UPI001FB181C8|nr:RING-H2 finger protein ATL16-like [Impatiens glandulifera]
MDPKHQTPATSNSSFPILAVAIIGILTTAILLIAYYIFVIKCCLNWHRFDLLTRFSFSTRRRHRPPISLYSPGIQRRGLDESIIQSIPTFDYPKDGIIFKECAVCLNEFHPGEKLRALPNCGHLFHVDCIDVWLQGNINCPLCRTSISINTHHHHIPFNQTVSVSDSDQISGAGGTDNDENYVVIELERETISPVISPQPKLKSKKLNHVLSMGDEWIDMREKDDRFLVQPMRRSFSMDSASDRLLCLAVQGILQRAGAGDGDGEVNGGEGFQGSRVRKSIFSFGHGRGSRNAILPLSNLGP